MKVGIIAANNIRYSPYIKYYTKILDEVGVKHEVIFPNRSNVNDSYSGEYKEIEWKNHSFTTLSYLEYAKKVKATIEKNKYDFLIILTGNNAVFLAKWLKKKYPARYIVDIRDFTHENILPYYSLEKVAVSNSKMNVISSRKFEEFLPKATYYTCHNISAELSPLPYGEIKQLSNKSRIIIGYIGKGGYLDQCKKLCELIELDQRFELHIYGLKDVPEQLREFAKSELISFRGQFLPEEKASIIQSIDILFNIYGHGTPLLDYALSNKLYDAFQYRKPILTSPNTYMSEMAGPLRFNVDFDNDDNILDNLYQWYNNIDNSVIESYSRKILERIKKENDETRSRIVGSILSKLGEKY